MTEEQKQEQHEHLLGMKLIEEECSININDKIEYPPIALSYGTKEVETRDGVKEFPIPIGTYGNFSFVHAPPKSMKTFFMTLLSSVYANSECEYTRGMDSFRGNRELVHFDTEQGEWHAQRVFKRIKYMNPNINVSNFYHTFALRRIGWRERVEFIEYYLKKLVDDGKEVGLVIIDGIADLVSDVNSLEDCNNIVQKLMQWTAVFDCHIVTVIHSNWGTDKPTGHLGSALEKKAETQIKLGFDELTRCVTATCKRSRGESFKDISFKLNGSSLPVIQEQIDQF